MARLSLTRPIQFRIHFTPEAASLIPPTAREAYSVTLAWAPEVGDGWGDEDTPFEVVKVSLQEEVIVVGVPPGTAPAHRAPKRAPGDLEA